MTGLEEAVVQVCDYLNGCMATEEMAFHQSFTYETSPMPDHACRGYVGVHSAEIMEDSLKSSSIYNVLKLGICLELMCPKALGGRKLRSLFDQIASAMLESKFQVRRIFAQPIKFNQKLQTLVLETRLDLEFLFLPSEKEAVPLCGYELRREVSACD